MQLRQLHSPVLLLVTPTANCSLRHPSSETLGKLFAKIRSGLTAHKAKQKAQNQNTYKIKASNIGNSNGWVNSSTRCCCRFAEPLSPATKMPGQGRNNAYIVEKNPTSGKSTISRQLSSNTKLRLYKLKPCDTLQSVSAEVISTFPHSQPPNRLGK